MNKKTELTKMKATSPNNHDQNNASRAVLTESQQSTFPYHIRAFDMDIRVNEGVFSPKHFNGWKIFNRHFPDVTGQQVLEVGCGTGVTSVYLAKNGAKSVVAFDINPLAVENTRQNAVLNNVEVNPVEFKLYELKPEITNNK